MRKTEPSNKAIKGFLRSFIYIKVLYIREVLRHVQQNTATTHKRLRVTLFRLWQSLVNVFQDSRFRTDVGYYW